MKGFETTAAVALKLSEPIGSDVWSISAGLHLRFVVQRPADDRPVGQIWRVGAFGLTFQAAKLSDVWGRQRTVR